MAEQNMEMDPSWKEEKNTATQLLDADQITAEAMMDKNLVQGTRKNKDEWHLGSKW